jgi:hypothetical protein
MCLLCTTFLCILAWGIVSEKPCISRTCGKLIGVDQARNDSLARVNKCWQVIDQASNAQCRLSKLFIHLEILGTV